jgi:hypothetical protein
MTYTERSEAGSEKIRTSIIQKVGGRFRVCWLGDGSDRAKNVLEDATQLELLQPADDLAERLHRHQPLTEAPL